MTSDEYLIEQYNLGDLKAFEELYKRYNQASYNFSLRIAGSHEVANDAYQTVWVKIIDRCDDFVLKIKKGDPPFVFKSYFFAMLRNAIFDKKNKTKLEVTFDEDALKTSSAYESELEAELIAEASVNSLLEAIDNLPIHQKETFLLIKECGLSLKEVAKVQGISLETAKTRRRYAYDKLRPILERMH